jgi:hypothetical protein
MISRHLRTISANLIRRISPESAIYCKTSIRLQFTASCGAYANSLYLFPFSVSTVFCRGLYLRKEHVSRNLQISQFLCIVLQHSELSLVNRPIFPISDLLVTHPSHGPQSLFEPFFFQFGDGWISQPFTSLTDAHDKAYIPIR